MSLPGHAQRKRFDKDGRCVICGSGLRGIHAAAVCRANMKTRRGTDRWVAKVNAAGRELDARARSMHPDARSEAMASERAAFKKLAGGGPR